MGSHSVTCHPAEVTFQPLTQLKLVLDLATPEGCKAELKIVSTADSIILWARSVESHEIHVNLLIHCFVAVLSWLFVYLELLIFSNVYCSIFYLCSLDAS